MTCEPRNSVSPSATLAYVDMAKGSNWYVLNQSNNSKYWIPKLHVYYVGQLVFDISISTDISSKKGVLESWPISN